LKKFKTVERPKSIFDPEDLTNQEKKLSLAERKHRRLKSLVVKHDSSKF
jgi:hypothetical protein